MCIIQTIGVVLQLNLESSSSIPYLPRANFRCQQFRNSFLNVWVFSLLPPLRKKNQIMMLKSDLEGLQSLIHKDNNYLKLTFQCACKFQHGDQEATPLLQSPMFVFALEAASVTDREQCWKLRRRHFGIVDGDNAVRNIPTLFLRNISRLQSTTQG